MPFVYNQLFVKPAYPQTPLDGQTIIITGSNVGLGKEAARHCVRLNAKRVILAVRNTQAGEEAKADIESSTNRNGVCDVWKLDLGSYDSVKSFADRVIKELDRVDVLLENAGIAVRVYRPLEDNESTITINVISTYLLALLLLPKLQETAQRYNTKPRLTIVSSEVHAWSKFPERNAPQILETMNDKTKANMRERYKDSKLLEVLVMRHLAPLISSSKNKDVVLNMLNPGLCHSSLMRENDSVIYTLFKKALARTTEVGSRTLVAAATAGPETHGRYMSDGVVKEEEVAAWVRTPEGDQVAKKVWTEVSQKLEQISPGILENVQ